VNLTDFLALVVDALDNSEVPFMLTGSLAASYHGAPRATQDIDLVIEAEADQLMDLANTLRDAGLYISDDAVREAAELHGQFNAVDPEWGWKADFIVRKERPFSRSEFESRQSIEFAGLALSVTRAEDFVVAKLEWCELGDSERQLRDAAEIVLVQGEAGMDFERIERWVRELSLEPQWRALEDLVRQQGGSI